MTAPCIRPSILVLCSCLFDVADPDLNLECGLDKLRIAPKKEAKDPFEVFVAVTTENENAINV